jgi:hypothetical protein
VAEHFSIQTFGVRPERLHEAELDALCSAHVVLFVCQTLMKESTVLDVLSVTLLMASTNTLLVPLFVCDSESLSITWRIRKEVKILKFKIAGSKGGLKVDDN